jgi:squalene-hopene/tetraprenyl-beta-curcumene cyclase
MRRFVVASSTFIVVTAAVLATAASQTEKPTQKWDTTAAAQYLDKAEERWATFPRAHLERDTFCVSCHTASLYALARPALRAYTKDSQSSVGETKLIDNVLKRMAAWNEIAPYYPDQRYGLPKTSESRAVEAIMNALVLATRDTATGHLSDEARQAFKNMWYLQMQRGEVAGSWAWMNFHLDPWEGDHSAFYGASLAALAIGTAPQDYAKTLEIQDGVKALLDWLQRHADNENLFNASTALWASSVMPTILKPEQKQAVKDKLLKAQAKDGGWSMSVMGDWKRLDGSSADLGSDGYATGLAVLALTKSGDPAVVASVQRGITWLVAHQDKAGMWHASSVNKHREISDENMPGYFMTDAASAMAVLALTASN